MGRKRHEEHEEHENHERWLVTYADMITLLMVLFIVLFAMSTVDQKKFNALKEGLAAGFGQSNSVLTGSEALLDQPGTSPVRPVAPLKPEQSPEIARVSADAVDAAERLRNQRAYAAARGEAERLDDVRDRVLAALREAGIRGDVRTSLSGRGLTLGLVSRHVVFEANLARLSPRGEAIVDTLAPVLAALPDDLQIEGHTNQAPGAPKYYASDWDLSAARAVTVLRRLNELGGVPAERLAAVGYGKIRPAIDPSRPHSQELNKRVDIVVLSSLGNENASMLAEAAKDLPKKRRHSTPRGSKAAGPGSTDQHDTDTSGGTAHAAAATSHDAPAQEGGDH